MAYILRLNSNILDGGRNVQDLHRDSKYQSLKTFRNPAESVSLVQFFFNSFAYLKFCQQNIFCISELRKIFLVMEQQEQNVFLSQTFSFH